MFSILPWKGGKQRTIFGSKDSSHWPWWCRFRIPLEFFNHLLPSERFGGGRFFRNISASNNRIFVVFCLDLHFRGHMFRALNGQIQYDYFCENFMKIGWMVSEIFNVFLFFHVTHFPHGKWRLSYAATPYRLQHILNSSNTSIIICNNFWQCWVISEIHITLCSHSNWKRWKTEQNSWTPQKCYWPQWCRIRKPIEIFDYLLPSARFNVGSGFKNIRLSKMSSLVNFDLELHFQIQELDDQSQCDHFGNTLWKSVEWCRRYSTFFLFCQVTHFPPGNGD